MSDHESSKLTTNCIVYRAFVYSFQQNQFLEEEIMCREPLRFHVAAPYNLIFFLLKFSVMFRQKSILHIFIYICNNHLTELVV